MSTASSKIIQKILQLFAVSVKSLSTVVCHAAQGLRQLADVTFLDFNVSGFFQRSGAWTGCLGQAGLTQQKEEIRFLDRIQHRQDGQARRFMDQTVE